MKLGFIGLGRMGYPIATRLLQAGHELVVFDVRQEPMQMLRDKGASLARSPADVGSQAEIVFMSLPTPEAVKLVSIGKNGIYESTKCRILIDLSTTGPRVAKEIAIELSEKEIQYLDAPVSGGVSGAQSGLLTVMVSGPRDVFDRSKDILGQIGKTVYFVGGKVGQGQIMKLINNLLSSTALAITSEGMALGVKEGLDPKIMLDVLNAGSGRNSATVDKFPRSVITRTFNQGFPIGLMYKDLKLCLDESEAMGVPMWVGGAVRQLWGFLVSQNAANDDFSTIAKHIEKWSGVEIKSSSEMTEK